MQRTGLAEVEAMDNKQLASERNKNQTSYIRHPTSYILHPTSYIQNYPTSHPHPEQSSPNGNVYFAAKQSPAFEYLLCIFQ